MVLLEDPLAGQWIGPIHVSNASNFKTLSETLQDLEAGIKPEDALERRCVHLSDKPSSDLIADDTTFLFRQWPLTEQARIHYQERRVPHSTLLPFASAASSQSDRRQYALLWHLMPCTGAR